MGWETRKGRGAYYTRSRRVRGRVVRQYLGRGALAEVAAAANVLRRAQAAARRAEQAHWDVATALLRQLCMATDLLTRATWTVAGYHRHDRGVWRRKRHDQDNDPCRGT
jgi:hypothetical protein